MEALRVSVAAMAVVLLLCCSAVWAAPVTPTPPSGGGCIQRLIPCQPYIRAPNPPPTCCVPLKEIVDSDITCLCSVFNNADMLRSLNLTKSNALDLPKACGINADVSVCSKNSSATPPPTATPMTPPASTNGSSSTGGSATGGSATSGGSSTGGSSNAAATTVSFIGLNFISVFIATSFF